MFYKLNIRDSRELEPPVESWVKDNGKRDIEFFSLRKSGDLGGKTGVKGWTVDLMTREDVVRGRWGDMVVWVWKRVT